VNSRPAPAERLVLPPHAPGLKIGLFGGTFDPPHAAHRAVTLLAMRRLGLDRVWWLVTPGNPLKANSRLPPLAERIANARALARHPGIDVTGIEAAFGTRYTVDTITALLARARHVRFVWLMGADNLRHFDRWKNWREIATRLPIAVIDRPEASLSAFAGRAAQSLGRYRVPEHAARTLPMRRAPAWVFLHGLKSQLSSTRLRAFSSEVESTSRKENASV
jgi:nicotinate-nucleotide adenylyltransferase